MNYLSPFFTLPPFLSKDFPMEKAVKKSAPAPAAGTDERACGAGRRLVPGRVCKVVEPLVEPAPELERVRILGNPTAPLVTCPPAHLPTSSAVTCPASDIRHSGAGCASAKKIWVGTLWILTILTNNGYFNELTNWLFVNHIVFIFKKNQLKREKWGKSSEPWSHISEPCLVISGLAGASSFSSCYLCRELPRRFKVSVKSRIVISKHMLQLYYSTNFHRRVDRLSSLSLLSSVAVGGFEEMVGDQMQLRSGWPQVFFCNAGTGFCDCGAACRVFPIPSLTLELCPQLTI